MDEANEMGRRQKFPVVQKLKTVEERKQLTLLEHENYIHAMYLTNVELDLEEKIELYEKRGKCENYIKECKYDMNIGLLKMKSFWANEAFFQLMMLVYNIFLLFKLDNLASCEYRQFVKTFSLNMYFWQVKFI